MATINSKGQLSGTVGPYSFRVVNGKAIVQSKPGRNNVKQTEATKSSASDFGKASYTAKQIRLALFTILQNMTDSRMHIRFATKVYETALSAIELPKGKKLFADGNFSVMQNFEFNSNSLFSRYATIKPQATLNALGQIQLSIPKIYPRNEVLFPIQASDCQLCFMVSAFDKDDYVISYCEVFNVELSLESRVVPPQEFITPELPKNAIVFVCQALFYYRKNSVIGKIPLNSKEVHPVSILGVFKTEEA